MISVVRFVIVEAFALRRLESFHAMYDKMAEIMDDVYNVTARKIVASQ